MADDPELRRLLDAVQAPRARPADAQCVRSWRRCSELADDEDSADDSLTSRRRARASTASRASRRCTGSETLSRLVGREVQLKAENLQRTGSFKIRGAYNRISTLDRRGARGRRRRGERGQPRPGGRVGGARGRRAARASSCRRTRRWRRSTRRGTTAPRSSSAASALEDCLDAAQRVRRASTARRSCIRSRTRVVIAGQGTIGLELAEQVPERRDGRHPDRRRRARVGHRARAARGEAGRAHRRRAGGGDAARRARASRSRTASP